MKNYKLWAISHNVYDDIMQEIIPRSVEMIPEKMVERQLMTSRHCVIFYVIWSHFGVHKATYAARKTEKLKKIQRKKTCHDLVKTWHDFRRPKHAFDNVENVSRWQKRDTIWGNPNSPVCSSEENVSRFT